MVVGWVLQAATMLVRLLQQILFIGAGAAGKKYFREDVCKTAVVSDGMFSCRPM